MKGNVILLSSLLALLFVAGCGETNNANDKQEQIADQLDPTNDLPINNDEFNNKLGYVHYTDDEIDINSENNHSVKLDHNHMADMISRMIMRSDGFKEVATLVTDQHVLISYNKKDEIDDDTATEIANNTARSVTPTFYDIYVSDNPALIQDIQHLHNTGSKSNNYENKLNRIISEMKRSPQGLDINENHYE